MGTYRGALRHEGRIRLGPVAMRRLLDVSSVGLGIAMVAQLGDFEILLQALWVLVAIGAFLYGLRGALLRIVLVAVVAFVYSQLAVEIGRPIEDEPLDEPDVAEWPLMIGISVIVAILADRIATSAAHYAALYRQASERLLSAQEEERARLARDLHDGVGQTLTAIVLTLDAADADLRRGAVVASGARSSLQHAQELAGAALEETRDVATRLRPTRITEIGLGAALRNLAGGAGVQVEVRFDPAIMPPNLLAPDRELDAYRIVQAALGNAARHSGARNVWLDAAVSASEIRVEIGDDGVGFDSSARKRGLGLSGMSERAAILGARLDVRSRPGAGTTVTLGIPRAHSPDPLRSHGAAIQAARIGR